VDGTKWGYFRTPNYTSRGDDKVKPEPSPAVVLGAVTAGVAPRDVCTLDFIPTSNYYMVKVSRTSMIPGQSFVYVY
jgi:hypothetical protein